MDCGEAQILLASQRDLSLSQRAELAAHTARCRACAAAAAAEARTSRALALLRAPDLMPPPQVAQSLARHIDGARASRARRRGLALAATLAAGAGLLLLMLNLASGGLLLRWLSGPPAPQLTGAAPAPAVREHGPLLYYAAPAGPGELRLYAYDTASRAVRFSLPLGDASVVRFVGGGYARLVVDAVLSPDGSRLYTVQHRVAESLLSAYDARSGQGIWSQSIAASGIPEPLTASGSLTISPDGASLYLRVRRDLGPGRAISPLELRRIDAATGVVAPQPIGSEEATLDTPLLLPLAGGDLLTFSPDGTVVRFGPGSPRLPGREGWTEPDAASAAARRDAERTAAAAYFAYQGRNSVPFSASAGYALDGGRRAILLSADLSVAEVEILPDSLRLVRELDPLPRERFFFTHSALSADGSALAVARRVEPAEPGDERSVVKIFRTGSWELIGEHSFAGRLIDAIALSPDGATLYLATSHPVIFLDPGMPTLQPPPPGATVTEHPVQSSLLALDIASGEARVLAELPAEAGLLIGGR